MKKRLNTLVLFLTCALLGNAQYTYPVGDGGHTGYDIGNITSGTLDGNPTEATGSTSGYFIDCDIEQLVFNFFFPNRDVGGTKCTLMKYEIYTQNWLTGSFYLVYSSNWDVPGGFQYNPSTSTSLLFVMASNPVSAPTIEPFHLYYAKVFTKKDDNCNGNYATAGIEHEGNTETIIFGPCRNECGYSSTLTLGTLNSSAANQTAGYYNPKYETNANIISSTPLANGEQLILDAGTEIHLISNFFAALGSEFEAYIDGCGGRGQQQTSSFQQQEGTIPIMSMKIDGSINLYPNPNNGLFNVSAEGGTIEKIEIKNSMGQTVKSFNNVNITAITIDLTREEKGIYFVKVKLENNEKEIFRKIIKQ